MLATPLFLHALLAQSLQFYILARLIAKHTCQVDCQTLRPCTLVVVLFTVLPNVAVISHFRHIHYSTRKHPCSKAGDGAIPSYVLFRVIWVYHYSLLCCIDVSYTLGTSMPISFYKYVHTGIQACACISVSTNHHRPKCR